MNNRNVHELERWIGRSEEQVDRIDAGKLRALFATLDQDQSSVNDRGMIPALAAWTYFTTAAPWHALGPDGHPARVLFLPPVALPRRMWAGGSFTVHGDLRVGDQALLFRYSALTFNEHRIHYDRSYPTGVEGYPGLVVHGPLIATFLLELLRSEHPNARVRRFTFKSLGPLLDIQPFQVAGRQEAPGRFALWASDADGRLAMQASAEVD